MCIVTPSLRICSHFQALTAPGPFGAGTTQGSF
jgi:hypothetical protein